MAAKTCSSQAKFLPKCLDSFKRQVLTLQVLTLTKHVRTKYEIAYFRIVST